ncbi:MAG: glycosyltransferase family 4 protein [Candidatus Omnitrophica bacterium]|nr:glycosyltransferase family 4 protein [Candidatus Omnitrophota bacterium]
MKIGTVVRSSVTFISMKSIESTFFEYLGRKVELLKEEISNSNQIESAIARLLERNINYLYIDDQEYLLLSLIVRKKCSYTVPYLVRVHTIYISFFRMAAALPLLENHDVVIVPSAYCKRLFEKLTKRATVHIIPYGLDFEEIRTVKEQKKENSVCFLGRLSYDKGLTFLIEWWDEIIAKAGPAHLKIIGPLYGDYLDDTTPSDYVSTLNNRIAEKHLEEYVRFEGLRVGIEKLEMLSRSLFLLNPTFARYETFSLVNIEALACGLPVIASDWAANSEFITNGINGVIIPLKSISAYDVDINKEEWIHWISHYLQNRKEVAVMEKNARSSVKKYEYSNIIDKLVALLATEKVKMISGDWESYRNKRPIDFISFYTPYALFFLKIFSGIHHIEYHSLIEQELSSHVAVDDRAREEGKVPTNNVLFEKRDKFREEFFKWYFLDES